MAECGLRPIRFCQFFGEEASTYVTGQQANFGLTRWREISIHCTGYGESSKESSVFFLWAKEIYCFRHYEIVLRGIQPYLLHGGAFDLF